MEIFSFTLLLKRRSKIWVYLLQKVVDRGSLISLDTARLDEPTAIYLETTVQAKLSLESILDA
jgi:hypothetical protein